MATPPFSINEALPADDDIVSQHPGNARTFRDVVEDWITVEHDTYGHHSIPAGGDSARNAQDNTAAGNLWFNTEDSSDEHLQIYNSGSWKRANANYVMPAGLQMVWAGSGSLPSGWLECDGSAVSRTTYADLFSAIGETYGVGDGATTFNLPDCTGRVVAGKESSATRLTSTYGPDGGTLAATGGSQSHLLTGAQSGTSAHLHDLLLNSREHASAGTGPNFNLAEVMDGALNSANSSEANASEAHPNVQPTIVQRWVISTGGV